MSNICRVAGLFFVVLLSFGLFVEVTVLAETLSLPEENAWVEVASMQQTRSQIGAAAVGDKIYAIGGYSEFGAVNTVEQYNPQTNRWLRISPMPTPRYGFATVSFMDKIYCIGGRTSSDRITNMTEVYNPATNRWETVTAMPIPRAGVSACVVNGSIYVMGGFRHTDGVGWESSGLWQIYNPLEDTWVVADASWPEGDYCVSLEDKIYAFDSFELWIYDILGDVWERGAQVPANSAQRGMASVRGVMATEAVYVYGDGLDVYLPYTNSWARGADIPHALDDVAVVEMGDQLYVLGGLNTVVTYPYGVTCCGWVTKTNYFKSVFMYTPLGYGRVAPIVSILSFEEQEKYDLGDVPLEFGLNRPAVWMGYSLDGQANVTVTGNVTLSGLSSGQHSVRVFVEDEFGNVGVSDIITFSVVSEFSIASELFSLLSTVAVIGVVAVICGGLLFLFLRKRRSSKS